MSLIGERVTAGTRRDNNIALFIFMRYQCCTDYRTYDVIGIIKNTLVYRLRWEGRVVGSQFGGDLHVLPVERCQPVAVVDRGTSELLLLPEHHVIVGGTDDGRSGRGLGVVRRVERHVRPAERAGAAVRHAAAHARCPGRGRRFRAHRTVSVCGS